MQIIPLLEGLLKQSIPYLSGELDEPLPQKYKDKFSTPKKKPSTFKKRMENLSLRAHVPIDKVILVWKEETSKVDASLSNRWAIINRRVQERLGLTHH